MSELDTIDRPAVSFSIPTSIFVLILFMFCGVFIGVRLANTMVMMRYGMDESVYSEDTLQVFCFFCFARFRLYQLELLLSVVCPERCRVSFPEYCGTWVEFVGYFNILSTISMLLVCAEGLLRIHKVFEPR